MPFKMLDSNLKKIGATAAAVTAIFVMLRTVGVEPEPYMVATHGHVEEKINEESAALLKIIEGLIEELASTKQLLIVSNGKLAGKDIKEFWIMKCRGKASAEVDEIMQDDYDAYALYKGRDHNWRNNNGENEASVFEILRSKGLC